MVKKYIIWIILVLILISAGFFRFYHLKDKGLFFYDEGIYLCSAKAKFQKLQGPTSVSDLGVRPQGPTSKPQHLTFQSQIKFSRSPNFTSGSKFGYVFFIFLSFLIFGIKEYSSLLVSAFFGIGTVFLVFFITRRIYNQPIALLAGLIIAFSAMHIMYSRCGLPQSESIFFLCLGWYFYLLSLSNKNFWLFLCGFSIGIAFTSHYNLFPMLGIFLIFEIINLIKCKKLELFRLLNLIISSIMPIFIWHFLSIAGLKNNLFPATYLAELKASFSAIAEQVSYGIDPFFALYYLQKMEGWLIFLVFIFGSIYLGRRIKRNFNLPELTVLVLALFPVLWYGFYPHMRVLRSFAPMLPALAIVAAKSMGDFIEWSKIQKIKNLLIVILVSWIIGFGFYSIWPIINLKSSYKQIAEYVYKNDKKLISQEMEMYPVFAYYLGENVIPINQLKELLRKEKIIEGEGVYDGFLVNIWSFNKELKDIKPVKVFTQTSFSAFNAEGGCKDKYLIKNIPTKEIRLYEVESFPPKADPPTVEELRI